MKPILALTGPNDAFKRDYLDKELKNIPGDDIAVYYADETEFETIFMQLYQNSLFGANNVVIVKNISALSEKSKKLFEEKLIKYLDQHNADAILILLTDKFSLETMAKIDDKGEVVEFKQPFKNDLIRYIQDNLYKNAVQFDDEIPDFIVNLTNEDSGDVEMITEMLIEFSQNSKLITIEEAKSLLSRSHNMNIFDLIDGIFERDIRKAINALNDLKLQGEPITKINYMLLRSTKNLWGYLTLKNKSEASSKLKIKPYESKMLGIYARKADLKFASSIFDMIKRVELKIKTMADEYAFLEIENFIIKTAKP